MLSRLRRSMGDKDQGFTLIELLVVIIIIGILAAIAIPVFLNQRKKAADASLKSDLHNAAVIVETWAVDNPGAAVLPVGTREQVWAPGSASGVMDGLKLSPGSWVGLYPSASTVGGWCIYGINRNASKATGAGSGYLLWKSLQGGLEPTIVGGTGCA